MRLTILYQSSGPGRHEIPKRPSKHMTWISVKDRLPRAGEDVFIVSIFTGKPVVEFIRASPSHPNWRKYYTLWMSLNSLPKPPE